MGRWFITIAQLVSAGGTQKFDSLVKVGQADLTTIAGLVLS